MENGNKYVLDVTKIQNVKQDGVIIVIMNIKNFQIFIEVKHIIY